MEPGDVAARLRDIDMDGDPGPLQAVVGGYVDAHELGHQCFLYVPEDPEGRQLNTMATDLVKIAPTRQPGSFMPFAGFQQSIYGTAVLITANAADGRELTPNQKAYDMLAEAGIDVAVELPNGTVLSTNVGNGITDLVWKDKAPDSARSIIDVAFIPDFLLLRRDEKLQIVPGGLVISGKDRERLVRLIDDRLLELVQGNETEGFKDRGNATNVFMLQFVDNLVKQSPRDNQPAMREFLTDLLDERIEFYRDQWTRIRNQEVPNDLGAWEKAVKQSLREDYRDDIRDALNRRDQP